MQVKQGSQAEGRVIAPVPEGLGAPRHGKMMRCGAPQLKVIAATSLLDRMEDMVWTCRGATEADALYSALAADRAQAPARFESLTPLAQLARSFAHPETGAQQARTSIDLALSAVSATDAMWLNWNQVGVAKVLAAVPAAIGEEVPATLSGLEAAVRRAKSLADLGLRVSSALPSAAPGAPARHLETTFWLSYHAFAQLPTVLPAKLDTSEQVAQRRARFVNFFQKVRDENRSNNSNLLDIMVMGGPLSSAPSPEQVLKRSAPARVPLAQWIESSAKASCLLMMADIDGGMERVRCEALRSLDCDGDDHARGLASRDNHKQVLRALIEVNARCRRLSLALNDIADVEWAVKLDTMRRHLFDAFAASRAHSFNASSHTQPPVSITAPQAWDAEVRQTEEKIRFLTRFGQSLLEKR